jgi:hypothetical protein
MWEHTLLSPTGTKPCPVTGPEALPEAAQVVMSIDVITAASAIPMMVCRFHVLRFRPNGLHGGSNPAHKRNKDDTGSFPFWSTQISSGRYAAKKLWKLLK